MPATWMQKDPEKQADTLVVFLPGRHDKPEDFIKNGFVEALWSSGKDVDVVIPDAHLGYYYRRTFSERLRNDIIERAREMGYRRIWAVGVSLGGFGAVMFERDYPGTWDGIVLVAPFAGDQQAVLKKVLDAENLQSVTFSRERDHDDYTENFWEWLQSYERDPQFPIYLGYGDRDRMQAEQAMIADILPQNRVVIISGNHEWNVWRELWLKLLPLIQL